MKYYKDNIEIGMRFYTFISEDEYKLYDIISIKEDEHECIVMDEETQEIETITEENLNKDYVLLDNYERFNVANFMELEYGDSEKYTSNWVVYNDLKEIYNLKDLFKYDKIASISMMVYPFMKPSIFNNLINYIIQYNLPEYKIVETDAEELHVLYLNMFQMKYTIVDGDDYELPVDGEEIKVPDALIEQAEELLNCPILTYECYEYDSSINLVNVNMMHFFLLCNDKYYLVLYVIDNVKESYLIQKNLQEHMDVVEFMLK